MLTLSLNVLVCLFICCLLCGLIGLHVFMFNTNYVIYNIYVCSFLCAYFFLYVPTLLAHVHMLMCMFTCINYPLSPGLHLDL